jgi:5-formyltetrahydrofolate cyclo-ligase
MIPRLTWRSAGKNLFVPKVDPALPGGMDLLRIQDEEDLRSLPSGVWGIKEPTFQYLETPRMKGPYRPLLFFFFFGFPFDV